MLAHYLVIKTLVYYLSCNLKGKHSTYLQQRLSSLSAVRPESRTMAHAKPDQIIRDLLQNIAKEQKFTTYDLQVTPMSTCGANYTSHLFLATISEGKKELNLFCKVAAIGEKMRSQFPMNVYNVERLFYTNLAKVYCQLEEKHNVPEEHRLKVPKFYGCNDKLYEETIVLENMTANGYASHDRFKSIDWHYAASAVTELAKLHALSVAYQIQDPLESGKVLEDLKYDVIGDDDFMKTYWDKIVVKAIDATKEVNKDRLKKFFENGFIGMEAFMQFYAPGKLAVIAHGDFRPSNLMHKVQDDGSMEVVPVDYQTMRSGNPVVDLMYFVFTGTDAQFRAHYYQKLIDHYYAELSAALTRLGVNPDEKYSREDYEFELKAKLPFGLGVAVFALPIVTVDAENAPKVTDTMELTDFSIQNTSGLFSERLNEVVDDFVKWGVL